MKRFLFRFLPLLYLAAALCGCGTIGSWAARQLPPQPCMPSADLPATKHVAMLPEVDTSNDKFFDLFLHERATHAKDDQDYNSLYATCVGGSDVPAK